MMSDDRSRSGNGFLADLMKAKPAKPGEIYGVPGQGESFRISAVVIVLLISFWAFVTYAGYIKPLFLPSPMGVVDALFDVMKDGFTGVGFWEHIWVSTLRVFGAFVLACVIGIPLGIAMGMSPVARGIFDPPIEFYRPIPPLAYLPLMIIWFGIDELSKVLLIFSSVLAPMVLGPGRREVGGDRADSCRLLVWRHALAGNPHGHPASGHARDLHRDASGYRFRLDYTGGGRNGGGHIRPGLHGALRFSLSADAHRHHGHRRHSRDRLWI